MFQRMSFIARVLLLPTVAAAAMFALIGSTWILGSSTADHLERVQVSLYPGLVLFFEMRDTVKEIESSLQDAATFESEDAVNAVGLHHDSFLTKLEAAKNNPLIADDDIVEIESLFDRYYVFARQTSLRVVAGDQGESVIDDVNQMRDRYQKLLEAIERQLDQNRHLMEEAFEHEQDSHESSLWTSLVVALISFVVLLWVSYGVVMSVRKLTHEVTGSASRISSSSSEVLAASRQQEHAANQHASAIEETSRTIASLAESSRSIAHLAEDVLKNAQRTQQTNQEIAERNRRLTERIEGITSILESVKDIANKSELLALNAALEGTKAGEAGRGFSLVAVQMQRLAENVMGNVQDVKQLTREIREANHTTVLAIEEGTKLAEQTTETAGRIRMVTQQQESATQQVTENMGDAAHRIQQTVAGARQATNAMESLADLAGQLDHLLVQLRLVRDRRTIDLGV